MSDPRFEQIVGNLFRGALAGSGLGPIIGAVTGQETRSAGDAALSPVSDGAPLALLAAMIRMNSAAQPVRVHWAIPVVTISWTLLFVVAVLARLGVFPGAGAVPADDGVVNFSLGILAAGSVASLCFWIGTTIGSYSKTAWARQDAAGAPIVVPAPTQPATAPTVPSAPETGLPALPPTTVPPPVPAPLTNLISEAAHVLILSAEVTSRANYEQKLMRPIWPGDRSGVTIGIGYDIGASGETKESLKADWGGRIPDTMIKTLESAIGKTGEAARAVLPSMQSVVVPWDAAIGVFNEVTIPQEFAKCVSHLPNFSTLSPDSRGAIVSLVMNRGPSFNLKGDRYSEMRAIKAHMAAKNFDRIPDEIRSMKRLWPGVGGLLKRRDAEATLFERGLSRTGEDSPLPTGADLVAFARKFVGRQYANVQVPKNDANYQGAFDCAELISYVVYQITGRLVGVTNKSASPADADAYTGAFENDAKAGVCRMISVDDAARTPGAVVLRYPPTAGMGHIAFSTGTGGTIEAHSTNRGVIEGVLSGRRWDTGLLIPGVNYEGGAAVHVSGPALIYAVGQPNMDPEKVRSIQRALVDSNYAPGAVDGEYGPNTAAAVGMFQDDHGLVRDGEVGPETAKALGITLS